MDWVYLIDQGPGHSETVSCSYSLHDPDLQGREVVLEQGDAGPGPGMPVAADVAHRGWHAEGVDQRAVLQV